jgi:hypothetical protein
LVGGLAALETVAWAQSPAPPAASGDGIGIGLALAVIGMFLLAIVVGVKLYDRRRRLADEDMALEARVSDVLMTDPALAGLPVAAHVEREGWSESAPTHVEVTGTVTSPLMEAVALKLVTREVLPARPGARIESHLEVDPAYRRAA